MIHELRHYIPAPDGAWALQDRFEHQTLALFARAGISVTDYWVAEESGEVWYVVEWESPAAMRAGWEAFRNNPEWIAVKKRSEAEGSLIERIDTVVLRRPGFFRRKGS